MQSKPDVDQPGEIRSCYECNVPVGLIPLLIVLLANIRRMVSWGSPMSDNELPYLKGIGIRVHTVRYQKIRNRAARKDDALRDEDGNGRMSSREFLKMRGMPCSVLVCYVLPRQAKPLTSIYL